MAATRPRTFSISASRSLVVRPVVGMGASTSSVTVPAAAQPLVDSIRDHMPGAAVLEAVAPK